MPYSYEGGKNMKKLRLISVSILFAALCLIFTACNQGLTAGKGTGTVRIVIDNGATRAVNAEGMPQFDESNTKITVTGEDGNQLAEGTTSVTLTLDIGKKINIKVVVKTDAGVWRGSKEHTVTAGNNDVVVKLSKAPKSVGNILSYVVKKDLYDSKITLKLVGKLPDEKLLVENSGIGGNYLDRPVIARDSSGRIYMLYDKGGRHLTRFDAEGNPHCEIPLNTLLSSARISTMTVDAKTNTIFVFDANSDNVYALTESGSKTFTLSAPFGMSSLASAASFSTITAAAAYNNVLFLVTKENKLIACKVTLSDTSLSLEEKAVETLESLRPSAVAGMTECTGAFADENNVYCLLREQKSDASQLYMIGELVRYTYSEEVLADKKVIGLHSKADQVRYPSLAFEENTFVNPVGFIGYDEEYLYIADDGAEISEHPYMSFCIVGNKDRIAKVNRDTFELSFEDSGTRATWFAEYAAQYAEKIPHLLWSKEGSSGVKFELNIGGTKKTLELAIETPNIRYQKTARDSTGSVYVLYRDNATPSALYLERFASDGTKDTTFGTAKSGFTFPDTSVTDLAVDFKTADVFLLKRTQDGSNTKITIYMAKANDGYASFSAAQTVNAPGTLSAPSIDSVAAFDGMLFVAMDVQDGINVKKQLYAYTMNTSSIYNFSLTAPPAEKVPELPKLRSGTQTETRCTGLFADRQGVYALLTQQTPQSSIAPYALGKVVRFGYDGTTLTEDASLPNDGGLNPAASGTGSVPYNEAYLSNPAGFIGYDGDNLYFADDGANIEDINENHRFNGNKDRIMAFNRKDKTVSFISADEASWFEDYPKSQYKKTDTKVLLWQKDFINSPPAYQGARYWVSDNVSTAYPGVGDALWESTNSAVTPTDVFCYDQDGNLYIVYTDTVTNQSYVRCFTLQDGAYDKTAAATLGQNLTLPTGINASAIAVDISDGNHYLYYATKHKVERYGWTGTFGGIVPTTPSYSIDVSSEDITALAANRDGVFVATKKQGLSINPYTLRIRKYKKDLPVAEDGHIVIVNEAASFDAHNAHNPYNTYEETIHDLQVVNGVLYAVTSRITKTMKEKSGVYTTDKFRSNGLLYKAGNTKDSFSGTGKELHKQEADEAAKTGYGFCRFIAVKPKKLVIASDGAYGTNGADSSSHTEENTNSVFEFDLDGNLQNGENGKKAEATFSKQIGWSSGCGFAWE
jgi:putative lipoprotein